jgi:L-aminopeptidase/D-esterase-like protein
MALGVPDVRVGTWTAPDGVSGCTVVLPPDGSVGAIAVRGSAPGTREAAALSPAGKVEVCHGVVLAGGSAYGLAAADGAMRWLEERGTGYVLQPGLVVPIVGAAIVLDEAVAVPGARPGPDAGYAACDAAVDTDPAEGGVGVGAGCTVAKVAGLEHAWRSGQGIAVRRPAGVTVGAIVANNAVGEVVLLGRQDDDQLRAEAWADHADTITYEIVTS